MKAHALTKYADFPSIHAFWIAGHNLALISLTAWEGLQQFWGPFYIETSLLWSRLHPDMFLRESKLWPHLVLTHLVSYFLVDVQCQFPPLVYSVLRKFGLADLIGLRLNICNRLRNPIKIQVASSWVIFELCDSEFKLNNLLHLFFLHAFLKIFNPFLHILYFSASEDNLGTSLKTIHCHGIFHLPFFQWHLI